MLNSLLPVPWFTRTTLLGRSRQIVGVLTRHGLDWLVSQIEVEVLNRRFQKSASAATLQKQAEELRKAFEELGPTFIKLGQALSTRPDILPNAYIQELNKLQDEVPPAPFEDIRAELISELGHPLDEIFAEFDTTPIASASIGQVYSALLHNGRAVVVKVHRPKVEKSIEQDLEIIADMAEWLASHSGLGQLYDLVALVDEFSFRLRNELDYQREGHNADIIRREFSDDPCVYIPKVYWEHTTSRVITLERVYGIKITDVPALDQAGISRKLVAENSARFTLRQLFEFGFFHADPHPGNFYVQPDGSLAVMDFGMVGRFGAQMKNALIRLVLAISRGDAESIVDVLMDAGITTRRIRRSSLVTEMARLIEAYTTGTAQFFTTLQIFNQMMGVAFRHGLQLPSELTMLGRLITINEGISQEIYPEFRMLDFAAPYIKHFWQAERAPEKMIPRLGQATLDGLEFTLELPRQASRLLKQLERGQLELNVNYDGLREFSHAMQRMTNRLAIAVLLAATIVALGMVMVVYHPATWQKLGEFVFGLAFVSSLAFGVWLMLSIWRSGRS